ncbi:MAG: TetR/AcrR family transcriptional regulator [Corynebacteriales bacterium]|nr:TetR/AcrR family transcriptional regulator [Mycobacteriales bacterium]
MRILEAAARLFAERDPNQVTMDEIARAAGVGRGTLYRRYPDRAAIAAALLDEHERAIQEELLRGAPPLGPGAPPADRLAAFYGAMVKLLEQHAHLVLGTEVGRSRFVTGAYGFWRIHVRTLLVAAQVPDPDRLLDILLAPISPDVYLQQRVNLNYSPERITGALSYLARQITAAPTVEPEP